MQQPNVIFIIADQHRWDFMGYESNGVTHTPALEAMGKGGTILRSAYCTSPLCSPARAAIASGRYGMNSGCFTNLHELPPGSPGFVQQFRAAGYRTAAIGKTHMEIHAYDSDLTSEKHRAYMDSLGWDEICESSGNGMFQTGIKCAYSEYLREEGMLRDVLKLYKHWGYFMDPDYTGGVPDFSCLEFPLDERFQESTFVGDRAVEWLERRDRSQPFYLHVGIGAPHSPIEPNPRFMDLYRDSEESSPWGNEGGDEHLTEARRGYRAMISQIDYHVGRIVEVLDRQGALDNTIIVYTADHGEMAGDHDRSGKCVFYEGSARVPMIFSGPGVREGQAPSGFLETLDIGKTLCELCDVEPHSLDQGKSLLPVLRGERDTHRDTVYCEMGCDRMIRDERYKLMWGDPGSDTRKLGRLHLDKPVNIPPSPSKLFDLQEDPHELNDLTNDEHRRDAYHTMLEKLLVRIGENTQAQPNKSRGEYKPLQL